MSSSARAVIAAVWFALLGSGVAVVWSKHQARSLFVQLQALTVERDALDIEWGQLKLEQSAWSTHGRVEQTARVDLKMVIPQPDEVQIVAFGADNVWMGAPDGPLTASFAEAAPAPRGAQARGRL